MKHLHPLLITVALLALLAAPVLAQTTEPQAEPVASQHSDIAFGLRGGYTGWDGLSQLHLGAHLKMGEILPNVDFTPNIEAGFGDNVTVITVNGDVAYNFTEFVEQPWNVYGGGTLGFNYFNPDNGGSDTHLGLSALLGLERTLANDHEAMIEIRVGILDSPDFKLTFGYTFF